MEWIKFRTCWRRPIMMLSDEEVGRVLKALIAFIDTGEAQEIGLREDILLCQMIETLRNDFREYEENAEKRKSHARQAARARWMRQNADCMQECPEHNEQITECKNKKQNKNKNRNKNSETEKEKEKEAEKEAEEYNYCSEPPSAVSELPVEEISLNDGSMYPLYQRDVDEYARLYPAVDIIQELRNIRGWCMANPARRKTRKGVNRFINGWLSKAQDKGGKREEVPENPFLPYARGEKDCEVLNWFR